MIGRISKMAMDKIRIVTSFYSPNVIGNFQLEAIQKQWLVEKKMAKIQYLSLLHYSFLLVERSSEKCEHKFMNNTKNPYCGTIYEYDNTYF